MNIKYYVSAERQADRNPLTDTSVHLARLDVSEVDVQLDDFGDIEFTVEVYENDEHNITTYIDDLHGGAEIVDTPDDFDPEFTNGLRELGVYDTFAEAKVVYDGMITGKIKYNELEIY